MDKPSSSDMWFYELNTEKMATQIIRTQVNSTNEIGDNDVIIFADIDEMVSRKTINLLKHCELRHGVLSGAITMPMGNFNLAFRTDFPVENKPHSMGRTTIVQVEFSGTECVNVHLFSVEADQDRTTSRRKRTCGEDVCDWRSSSNSSLLCCNNSSKDVDLY